MRNFENYDYSGFSGYDVPESAPAQDAPYQQSAADIGGGEYFSDPYISPQTGQPVVGTGLHLAPGQSYTPGAGRPGFSNYFSYAPSFSRGGYPSGGSSGVSYIGPTVSARPAFNLRLRGLKVKDVFNRRRLL